MKDAYQLVEQFSRLQRRRWGRRNAMPALWHEGNQRCSAMRRQHFCKGSFSKLFFRVRHSHVCGTSGRGDAISGNGSL